MHAIICILEFVNFMLFLIKFIKFKQRTEFKKFELHNYGWVHELVRWVWLGRVCKLVGWIGLTEEKATHGHLCVKHVAALCSHSNI